MSELRIGILGAAGRMGRELIRAAHAASGCHVAGGTESSNAPDLGADLGELAGLGQLGVRLTDDPLTLAASVDALLDFTTPAASVDFAALAANGRIVHVIGTTGFSDQDEQAIARASRHATIIKAGNMSLGVNLAVAMTRKIAAALDTDFDIEVVEMHHRHKVDAPSGTALMLGKAAAEGRGIDLNAHAVKSREGHTGERKPGDIGFSSLRGGDVVGDHTVIFAGQGERIEVMHKASDRAIFARGAVKAAQWGFGKGPGLFSMADVLGL
ncbi:MAG: 4-hydroxy-tetrahydrodipicolinate reductase [Alphaproteobacteria bacterium]|nr:4-hydroxy-tetrahydrodipicolinate reductase [Alphaproteobacteria bacterium]